MNDDERLLAAIRNGSSDEFSELVRRHQDVVFAILSRYERDAHRVADLAQDVFLRAWQALDRFDLRAPFSHWISRIATRVALDHLRRQRRRISEVALDDLGTDALDWLPASRPDSNPADEDARALLDLAMQRLSAEDQLVLTLLEIDERSVKETSQLTGWSLVSVRVRAYRARRRLARVVTELRQQLS